MDDGDSRDTPTVALLAAGGTGSRLYPASRPDEPKQFLTLGGDRTLLRRTADRAGFADEIYAVTREAYADRVTAAVPEATVLVDPGLDTGPALLEATHRIGAREGECVVCVLPTDHHVAGDFAGTMERAAGVARETDGLVCVGVVPDRPATGFGYIEPAEPLADPLSDPPTAADASAANSDASSDAGATDAPVARFREKPDADTAHRLVDEGCLWNAGIFAWRPRALLREAADSPLGPLVEALESDALAAGDGPADGVGRSAAYDGVPSTSVDHAVLERTGAAHVVPAGFEWDDLGTWDAIGRHLARRGAGGAGASGGGGDEGSSADRDANATLGDVLSVDASRNVLAAGDDQHVAAIGVEDLVVAAFDDRVLVLPRDEADRVREVVATLDGDGDGGDERS